MSAVRAGSMCSGYGGLDLAVEAVLGARLAWVAENDPDASKVLAHRFPGVPNLQDITSVDWEVMPSEAREIDILTAGFP